MKYEKYLKQIAEYAVDKLYWANFHADLGKHPDPAEDIFKQLFHIEHALWSIQWQAREAEAMQTALKIPKNYVENCKATKFMTVVNKWSKEKK